MEQQHSKFAVFIGIPTVEDKVPDELLWQVTDFVKDNRVAPKSIGVEFLERQGDPRLVMTLGYRDDEASFGIRLRCVSLGRLTLEPKVIGDALSSAAAAEKGVICHEFYVTDEGEFFTVLMSRVD